jgi:glutamine synthetase adenylyltransferase
MKRKGEQKKKEKEKKKKNLKEKEGGLINMELILHFWRL